VPLYPLKEEGRKSRDLTSTQGHIVNENSKSIHPNQCRGGQHNACKERHKYITLGALVVEDTIMREQGNLPLQCIFHIFLNVGPTLSTRVYFPIDQMENILVPHVFSISNGVADD